MKFELLDDVACNEYFYMNSDLGILSLKKLITDPNLVSFSVSSPNQVTAANLIGCQLFHL